MSLLLTRPRYDSVTNYLYFWSQGLIKIAKERRLKIFDLAKVKANKRNVESYLAKQNPSIVIFNGHGNEECVAGQNEEELISYGKNEHLLSNKVVYMRACSAGTMLGPSIIKAGATAFIGYTKPFVFISDLTKSQRPLEDEYAAPFLQCSNHVATSLIKGRSAQEAHEESLRMHYHVAFQMLTSNSPNSFLIPFLLSNRRNQVCYS